MMEANFSTYIFSIINFLLLIGIIYAVITWIKKFRVFINKINKMDEKIDNILRKIEK